MKRTILLICLSMISAISFSQWIQQASNTTKILRSACYISENTGIVVGDSGTILRTTDAGTIWTNISSGTTKNLNSVDFPSANIGFIAGDSSTILKTINGGLTWTSNYSGMGIGDLFCVEFQDENKGWVTSEGILMRTLDGGSIWYFLVAGIFAPYYSASFTDTTNGYAVGSAGDIGFIYKTHGASMTFLPQNQTGLYSVCFPDDTTGYAAGMYGTVVKTIDAGNTWNILQHDMGTDYYSIFFTDKNTGYIAGTDGMIKKTTDGGFHWIISSSTTNEELRDIFFLNADTGYAVGVNGTILKTNTGGIVSVENKEQAKPVFMIYPNPASEKIIIIPEIKSPDRLILTISNMIGIQESYEVLQNKSSYELDVSSFHKGLYLVKILTKSGFASKKLVIN